MKKIYLFILVFLFGIKGFAQTTFSYTGSMQYYTVPSGVTSITVDAKGAKGGGVDCYSSYQTHGGCGGRVQATVAVTPGHVLNITVGGQGSGSSSGSGGYGGGGSDYDFTYVWPGAGGGGASSVVDYTASTTLVVAGGGGGGGGGWCSPIGDAGGAGGGTTGAAGNCDACGYSLGGGGGTPSSGGSGGSCYGTGSTGSFGAGANVSSGLGSGAGGGGYYGGGSGYYGGGGGGGSSYANASYTSSVTHTQGSNCGSGSVIINIACSGPAAITGSSFSLCSGTSITLADTSSGGTWSSSSTGVATVGSTTGIVTGAGTGGTTATITYTLTSSGCYTTAVVTVNTAPAAISGTAYLCAGNTTTLSDASGAGTWTSGTTTVATIGPSSGVVYGFTTGTTTIVFTLTSTGCTTSEVVTVNPATAAITGTLAVCQGSTTTLADVTTGGSWSSLSSGIASVGTTTGIVTGASGGTTTITYMLASGCYSTAAVTVNSLPAVISGSPTVCVGSTTTLTDASGSAGTWSSGATGVATIGATTGIVAGISSGTTTITYAITTTGCYRTFNLIVNALPSGIHGSSTVCANASTILTDSTPGGTWSSSITGYGIVNSGGYVSGVSAGTTTITYLMSSGCYATFPETILPIPAPITGDSAVCSGSVTTLADITGGSTWSISGPGATIGSTTGIVTGTLTGLVVAVNTVTYTITSTGCHLIKSFTVNPLPATIAGITLICDSSTTNLFDALSGGTWSSSNTYISTIGALTGVVNGMHHGIDTITYTMPLTGCMTTTTLTVQPPPAPISGTQTVCPGLTTTLTDLIGGGTWLSGSTNATIDSVSGIINGISAGTSVITYVLGVCSTTEMITVNPLPVAISGGNSVCTNGATITLTDGMPGGHWSESSISFATIDSITGVVTSITMGSTTITYKMPVTGCYITEPLTVNPLPAAITGNDSVCLGYTTMLADGTGGGLFSSASSTIASVTGATGVVTGISPGTTQITYTLTGTGCALSVLFTVNPILTVSTMINSSGGDTICYGNVNTYTATSINAGPSPDYSWKVNTYTVSGVTGNIYSYSPANGDIVECVLTSNATCAIPNTATSNSITMMVNPLNHPTVTMLPTSQDTLCVGTVQNYSITSTSGGSHPVYLWTINWIPVGTGSTSYTYTPNNGDIIRCGMISSSPCPVPDTAFAIDTMVVKGYDTPRVAVTGLEGLSACQGNMITLITNTTWGGWGPKYYWSVNGSPMTIGNQQYTYLPADSDVISCMMISNYYCPIPGDMAMSTVTVKVDPILIVTITDSYGGLISTGLTDTMMAHVQNGGSAPAYQWYKNGIMIPGANSFRLIDREINNKDSISCMVTTGSGTACEGIKGDNWLIMEVAPTGIATIGTGISDIRLVPNPNTGIFTVEGTITGSDKDITLEITDVIGQEVYTETMPVSGTHLQHKIILDKGLANGVYILHLISENGNNVIRFTINR